MVHRVMTDALAALGVIALVASGQFNRYVSWAILISLGLALVVRESWQRHPALRHLDTGILLVVIAVQVVRIVATDASVLDVLVEFAAALQIIRLATRKGAAHDQQVIVLALLHLIAGTVLGGGIGYGLCFLGVLVVAPGALVLSHLRREVEGNYRQGARDRTGLPVDVPRILRSRRVVGRSFLAVTCLLSVPIFAFTALLFVIFPRVGLSLLLLNRGHTGRMIGFSGKVDLGAVGVLRSDPKLAMRVEIPELPDPPPPRLTMHLRGTALDAYDGRTWTQSETFKRPTESDGGLVPIERYPDPAVDPVMRIDLEPIDPPVIFLPPNATGLRLKHRGQLGVDAGTMAHRGPEGELRYQPTDERGLVYDVFLSRKRAPTFQRLPGAERRRYLELPRDLPSRVVDLAQQWTQGVDRPADRARVIQEHLRTEYRYDLASPSGADPQPLDHFLFESKRGHCEFYSTAMAILLRAVDVPTRNVTGFVGGTYNRFGRFYAVRQGDAHSWVEVYLDGEGWMTFDPTPPADAAPKSELVGAWAYLRDFIEATSQRWDRHVVGYDLNQQVGLLQTLTSRYRRSGSSGDLSLSRPRILTVAAVALALGGGVLYWRFRRTRRGREERRADAGRTPSAILATALYESLEAAMLVQGVPRPPSLPPLRHAEALELAEHPLAREILTLTQVYLRARFGGATLSEDDSRDFERRVKALRGAERRARAASESGLAASP
ncbi:putative membrane protein [Sorangium cellulosum So ce56]|uniref:Membrane protein n=2 Tax=Polyangiaceae TaxID=49 RepID=A9FNN5_SORC5|nr:putative membrane protein [Sorangium cellulosum So ce56]